MENLNLVLSKCLDSVKQLDLKLSLNPLFQLCFHVKCWKNSWEIKPKYSVWYFSQLKITLRSLNKIKLNKDCQSKFHVVTWTNSLVWIIQFTKTTKGTNLCLVVVGFLTVLVNLVRTVCQIYVYVWSHLTFFSHFNQFLCHNIFCTLNMPNQCVKVLGIICMQR